MGDFCKRELGESPSAIVKSEIANPDDNIVTPPYVGEIGGQNCDVEPELGTVHCSAGWDSDEDGAQPPPLRLENDATNRNGHNNDAKIPQIPLQKVEKVDGLPDDYFDSLIEDGISFEPINNSFAKREDLDDMDLLPVQVSEVPQESVKIPEEGEIIDDDALEALYKQRNKELEKLKKITSKKNKKCKTKDGRKKRRRSRSPDLSRKNHKRMRGHSSEDENTNNLNSRFYQDPRSSSGLNLIPIPKNDHTNDSDLCLPAPKGELTVKLRKLDNLLDGPPTQPTAPLTVREKRALAVERVTKLLTLIRLKSTKAPETEFLVVDTISKLPESKSYMNQGIFENPSPICNNFNVMYKFNSIAGQRFSLAKWGLEELPAATTELLRLTGIDAARLKELQLSTKLSQRILKLKERAAANANSSNMDDFTTSLSANASTQTEIRTKDAQVQARLESSSAFWSNPDFDETRMTQLQANVMYTLQALCKSVPNAASAGKLYKLLHPALSLIRSPERNS
ncbi:protein panoramix [Scaptodrosophila lebanonensis]|uniref:Protein panoramix n=1 Tax=Drosophila lebanonensis TaxID=7225 RepID=A0A6J2U1G7_DROLE|nr:protein panoramix [Scaptodrosophila lebanonensis]